MYEGQEILPVCSPFSWLGPLPLTLPHLSLAFSLVEEGIIREGLNITVLTKLLALMFQLSRLIRSMFQLSMLLRQPRLRGNEFVAAF